MNLIGDIQGNYVTLQALLKKMPDEIPVSVGDMIDRGPRSLEVLEFFRQNGNALMGNHEHMMLDHLRQGGVYRPGLWLLNGGDATLNSLGLDGEGIRVGSIAEFVGSLPLLIKEEGLVVTHAPIHQCWGMEDIMSDRHLEQSPRERSIIWNRENPVPREGIFQVFGHNGYRYRHACFFGQVFRARTETAFAVCIDTVRGRMLSGLHWPSLKVYEQQYID